MISYSSYYIDSRHRAVVRGGAGGVLERVDYVHHIIMLAQPGWTFYTCKSKKESKKECSTHCLMGL